MLCESWRRGHVHPPCACGLGAEAATREKVAETCQDEASGSGENFPGFPRSLGILGSWPLGHSPLGLRPSLITFRTSLFLVLLAAKGNVSISLTEHEDIF